MRMRFCCTGLLVLLIAVWQPMFAQVDSAALSGTVTDPSGAIITNAAVQAANQNTNITQTTRTNSVGLYSFPRLSPGLYRMSIKHGGFKEFVETDLVLHVGDTVSRNFKMELGSSSETVTVSASAVLVNTEDASVGTVVERQVLENMPLNGRSFQGLITLSPGVATVAPTGISAGQFVVNGQRSDTSAFSVDGVSANVGASAAGSLTSSGTGSTPTNSATGGFNHLVSIEALQEFRISTSNFAPEFGRSPGGQISLVSRAGTNAFHGSLFDYFRNTVLGASDWFLNAAGRDRGVVRQNDFGGVFGGPIVRNKLFFFASYEGLRLQAPSPSVKQVPTQAARTLAAAANSGGVVGYMAQFANAYPLPDGNPATPCTTFVTCAANYTASFPSKSVLDTTSARVDYRLGQNTTLFGRYAHSPSNVASDNSATTNRFASGNDVYTSGLTRVIGNSMSNDLRFNFTHSTTVVSSLPIRFGGSPATIFPAGYAQPPAGTFAGTYNLQIRGLPTDGLVIGPKQGDNGNDQINIVDSFGWVKGSHRFKFGVDYRQLNPSVDQASFNQGNTFAQATTALPGFPSVQNVCPALTLPAGAGAAVPGYICGLATQSNLQRNFVQHYRYRQYSSFAQDTWKIARRVTLTYGVRWEINPALQWTSNNPGFSIQRSSFNPPNLSTININPIGTRPFATTWGNFSPRAGLAVQLSDNPKWGRVLRAGYGMFFDTGAQAGGVLSSPYNGRFNNVGAGASTPTVQAPISPANVAYLTPPTPRLTLPVSNGGQDVLIVPDFKLPFVHQVNLTVEQQLGGKQTVTASYVAALGRRLIGPKVYPANAG
ncbi:MAG: TonB-dependent receptor, partial [Candidatus Solibacter usitatus]|nr:TonB-dependent receptor [Candidatus Solibacter usitatus]